MRLIWKKYTPFYRKNIVTSRVIISVLLLKPKTQITRTKFSFLIFFSFPFLKKKSSQSSVLKKNNFYHTLQRKETKINDYALLRYNRKTHLSSRKVNERKKNT